MTGSAKQAESTQNLIAVILLCILMLSSCEKGSNTNDLPRFRHRPLNKESDIVVKPFVFSIEKGERLFQVVSHRGVLPGEPYTENSREGILAAARFAKGAEFDLTLTKDGRFVLLHDTNLSRVSTCNQHNDDDDWAPLSLNWHELHTRCRLKSGHPIALYDEAFINEVSAAYGFVMAEIKTAIPIDLILNAIKDLPRPPNLIYTSYRIPVVEALISRGIPATFDSFNFYAIKRALDLELPVSMVDFRRLTPEKTTALINLLKGSTLQVVAYTVESREQNLDQLRRMVKAGILSAVLFDDPSYGMELEQAWRTQP